MRKEKSQPHPWTRRGPVLCLGAAALSAAIAFAPFAFTEEKSDVLTGAGPVPSEITGPQKGGEITALMPKLDAQIAAGRVTSPPGDNAIETLQHILALVPNATPAELYAIDSMPQRFDQQAARAKASGDEAGYRTFSTFRDAAYAPGGALGTAGGIGTSKAAPVSAPPQATQAAVADLAGAPEPVAKPPTTMPAANVPVSPTVGSDGAGSNPILHPVSADATTVPASPTGRIESSASHASPSPITPGSGSEQASRADLASASPEVLAALVERGKQRLADGDISAARLLFERAAEARSGGGAIGLARTYDPVYLAKIGAHGIQADLGLCDSVVSRGCCARGIRSQGCA